MAGWWKRWGGAILGGIESAIEIGASFVPGGSLLAKGTRKLMQMGQIGVGTAKDLMMGGNFDFGEFSANFDAKMKKGLDQAKQDLEAQGTALRGEMQGIKSELEGQLQQQGLKLEKEIKDLDRRMAEATGENRRAIEEEKNKGKPSINNYKVLLSKFLKI